MSRNPIARSESKKLHGDYLQRKFQFHEKGAESRTAIKAEIKSRKKASKSKKSRRKYRALEQDDKSDDAGEEAHEEPDEKSPGVEEAIEPREASMEEKSV